jgi:hypothetical protein
MSKNYVCRFSFGTHKKGDPYKGSDRDTAKLIKNGMICPLLDGGNETKKPKAKEAPEVLTNLPGEQLASTGETAQKKKAKKKRKEKAAD